MADFFKKLQKSVSDLGRKISEAGTVVDQKEGEAAEQTDRTVRGRGFARGRGGGGVRRYGDRAYHPARRGG